MRLHAFSDVAEIRRASGCVRKHGGIHMRGIRRVEKARRKAADLTAWLETLLHLYGDRVLAFDVAAARFAGVLSNLARSKGSAPASLTSERRPMSTG